MPGVDPDVRLLVLDASVAVRWILPERGATEALALLERPIDWIAPRLLLTEVASALHRKVVASEVDQDFATQGLNFLMVMIYRGSLLLHRDEAIMQSALAVALTARHKVADCVYLALAEDKGAGVATADRRLGELARSRHIPHLLLPSA